MNHTDIIITNALETGTAFAVVADNMQETVFVPSRVMQGKDLQPGSRAVAMLVPNHTRPDKTPWVAISLINMQPVEPPQPQPRRPALSDLILKDLEQGRATVEEIAESLNVTEEAIEEELGALVDAGRVDRLICFDLPEDAA